MVMVASITSGCRFNNPRTHNILFLVTIQQALWNKQNDGLCNVVDLLSDEGWGLMPLKSWVRHQPPPPPEVYEIKLPSNWREVRAYAS